MLLDNLMPRAPGELPALPGSGWQQEGKHFFLVFNQFKTHYSVKLKRLMLILYYLSLLCVCQKVVFK